MDEDIRDIWAASGGQELAREEPREVLHIFGTHAEARSTYEQYIRENQFLIEKRAPNNMVLYMEDGTRITYAKVASLQDAQRFHSMIFTQIYGLVEGTDWAAFLRSRLRA